MHVWLVTVHMKDGACTTWVFGGETAARKHAAKWRADDRLSWWSVELKTVL